jgi:hypothetical protein
MNWLCKFGIHKWTKWQATTLLIRNNWFPITDPTYNYERPGQQRECQKCGIEELR